MRDYENRIKSISSWKITSYESPWGIMRFPAFHECNKSSTLRIPMRDYEKFWRAVFTLDNEVTNPHEGLWELLKILPCFFTSRYESPWGIMSDGGLEPKTEPKELRIPMRDYEKQFKSYAQYTIQGYESPWGIMSFHRIFAWLKLWLLRIPMRDYEWQVSITSHNSLIVTNPHEGLWAWCALNPSPHPL